MSPDSNVFLDPTGNNGEHSFFLRADGNSTFVQISVDFDEMVGGRMSVYDLNFSIYDIDTGPPQWVDRVRARAEYLHARRARPHRARRDPPATLRRFLA